MSKLHMLSKLIVVVSLTAEGYTSVIYSKNSL